MNSRYLLGTVLVLLVFVACVKTAAEIQGSSNKKEMFAPSEKIVETSLLGNWELRELQGGFRPANAQVYYTEGNGNIWKFTDSSYKQYFDKELAYEGSYTLTKDTALATGQLMDAFILKTGDYERQIYFEFKEDTLLLYDGQIAADGTIGKYVRKVGP